MKKIIIALMLISSPVFACDEKHCWIRSHVRYQHDRMSENNKAVYIDISRDAVRVMHYTQQACIEKGVEKTKLEHETKKEAYREMRKTYPCMKSFLWYLFWGEDKKF